MAAALSVPQASLLTGAARNATVRSKTVATLHCLGKKEFTALLREHPEVFDNVERMIQASPRLRRAEKYDQSMQSVARVKHGPQRGREARITHHSRSSSAVSGARTTSPCAHAHSHYGHEPRASVGVRGAKGTVI
jgi:CRP-like cAMP-binding protein